MTVIGVTGTNGKTSTVQLLAQALSLAGATAGSIGTLGAGLHGQLVAGERTTPDVIAVHRLLAEMRDAGATHVAMEVSSHALAQAALDEGVEPLLHEDRRHRDAAVQGRLHQDRRGAGLPGAPRRVTRGGAPRPARRNHTVARPRDPRPAHPDQGRGQPQLLGLPAEEEPNLDRWRGVVRADGRELAVDGLIMEFE